MPPTQFLHLARTPGSSSSWQVEGRTSKDVDKALNEALDALSKEAAVAGLPLKDIMVKQGMSWGGDDVARVAPVNASKHLQQKILARLPPEVSKLTVLLQAKVDLIAELRWIVLHGELRGRGWRTFEQARRGQSMKTGGMLGEKESREALIEAGLANDTEGIVQLEESFRGKVEQVLAEAVADGGGEVPQYLRVDLLVDTQGRAWLGERESWGADLVKSTLNSNTGCFTKQDPSMAEVAAAIASRAALAIRKDSAKVANSAGKTSVKPLRLRRQGCTTALRGTRTKLAKTKPMVTSLLTQTVKVHGRNVVKRKLNQPTGAAVKRRKK
jgi:hypothetical protein